MTNDLAPVAQSVHPDRSKFLGGSDAAAVMGLSPWETPVELWQAKTGRKVKSNYVDPLAEKRYARGHKLEPFIREMVIDKLVGEYGLQVELVACNKRYSDADYPFLACEIDFELVLTGDVVIGGRLVHFEREHCNADAKSVTGFARKKWGDVDTEDVPIEYAAQFMHGLGVTDRDVCLVAALRSFDDVDVFWVLRDDETVEAMRAKMVDFWVNHVQADVPPDPINFADIKRLFPMDNGEAREATAEIADKVAELKAVKARLKADEEKAERLTFDIAEFISPNSRLTFAGADIATWKGQEDTRLDQQQFREHYPDLFANFARTKVVRVLRLPSPKKGKK